MRCEWAAASDAMRAYHDREWGVPVRDDRLLFEFLVLEGAQAGLSWETVLRKRDGYRATFAGLDPARVAAFGDEDVARLLGDARIIRNRRKIEAAIANARLFREVQAAHGSFARYLWGFVDDAPIQNNFRALAEIPAQTERSQALSRDLKQRGFKFVGPTICYAFMQAVGMVNDHVVGCYRHAELGGGE